MFLSHFDPIEKMLPDFNDREECTPICLHIFKPQSFFIKQDIRNITEDEEYQSVHNIISFGNDVGAFIALAEIIKQTKFESVKESIIEFFANCLSDIKHAVPKNLPSPRRLSASESLKSSISFESHLFTAATDDFEIITNEEEVPYDDKIRGLLEKVPTIYKHSSEDQAKIFNKLLNQILIAFAPSINAYKKGISHYAYFKLTIDCLIKLIILAKREIIPISRISHLLQAFFVSSVSLVSSLHSLLRIVRSPQTFISPYFGSIFRFVAKGIPFLTQNDVIIAQNFWISIVMCWEDVVFAMPAFTKDLKVISRYIPPLISIAGSSNYSTAAITIDNLSKIISFNRTSEQIGISVNKYFDQIPAKSVSVLPQTDAILLLSIGALEKIRAKAGDFATFFEYFKADYYTEFTNCLESMITPFFTAFMKHVQYRSPEDQKDCFDPLVRRCVQNYVGTNQKFALIIDKISGELFSKYNLALFSPETIAAFIESIKSIEKHNPSRLSNFNLIFRQMLTACFSIAPAFMFALLHNYFLSQIKNKENKMSSVYEIVSLMPSVLRDKFLTEMFTISTIYGGANKLTIDQIMTMENPDDRIGYLAFSVTKEEDIPLLIMKEASHYALIASWSKVMLCSTPEFSNVFIMNLIYTFCDTVKLNQGLFSTTYDSVMVNFHKSVLDFLQQLVSIFSHTKIIIEVLPAMKDSILNGSPAAISGLLRLALFLSTLLTKCFLSSSLMEIALSKFILVLTKIISLNTAPTIFRYLKCDDLFVFMKLLSTFPSINQFVVYNKMSIRSKDRDLLEAFSNHQKRNAILGKMSPSLIKKLLDLIGHILAQTFSLFNSYISSQKSPSNEITTIVTDHLIKPPNYSLQELIPIFWKTCPSSIPAIGETLNISMDEFIKLISVYFKQFPYPLAFESHLATFFAKVKIEDLHLCELLSPAQAIVLLTPEVLNHPTASHYLVRCLRSFELDEILQYIPQLLQSIRFDHKRILRKFLREYSKKSYIFQHYFLWSMQHQKCFISYANDPLPNLLVMLEGKIMQEMTEEEHNHYDHEFGLINSIDHVSQVLLPLPPEERKGNLATELEKITIPDDLYVPSNPNYKILDIDCSHSIPLKSHAKVPILVKFTVYDEGDPTKKQIPFSCIFKTHDDVRMDAMVIQLIDKFKRIFIDAGIDCYVLPYRVFATGQERGVIECISHAKSRHDLGVQKNEDLLSYFIHTYGQVGTEAFNRAQENFVKSMAPYSLICYLFQIKDRHNANIMIDEDGHVIHIDFGFIFDISPGGNLKFERAPFKLTQEMVNLMGGSREAKPFRNFIKLFTKCFIAVRARYEEIEAIASLMLNANFPCFKKNAFQRLKQRFMIEIPPSEISKGIEALIDDSMNSVTTSAYDMFQYTQNNIFYI
ncbi:Phosphatidylinositol 3- and 4-kinase family protein [Tritrichomonas foetus]|uniref:1-phosphatidylinositol 4-kinase n=1 Tax=Tritrichomonas foetus TaxID=1144522 RepID=A0A1J4KHB1_9EUKA|nr:Phosphatidylinositol 3- and 4-kinase family protein [Tritrichomonas foetus]|eukprot:OHT09220.1 Phosphatidylinositol 3- and 4-kinase family protein [Tritrichomonas foetus]